MNNIQQKLADHPSLTSNSNMTEFVKIFKDEISTNFYDIVEGLRLSEHFDQSLIQDYIEANCPSKDYDHYSSLMNYDSNYVQLFLDNNPEEFFNVLDLEDADKKMASFYQDFFTIDEKVKAAYFESRVIFNDLEANLAGGKLTILDPKAQMLFDVLELGFSLDNELRVYISTGLEDSVNVSLIQKDGIILGIKAEKTNNVDVLLEEVSSYISVLGKNIMSNTAKVALTGSLLLGLSMGAAMAGENKASFDDTTKKISDRLSSIQADVGGDCEFKLDILDHSGNNFTVMATVGDETIIIEKREVKGNKYQNLDHFGIGSKPTGKCKSMAGNDGMKTLKSNIINAISQFK